MGMFDSVTNLVRPVTDALGGVLGGGGGDVQAQTVQLDPRAQHEIENIKKGQMNIDPNFIAKQQMQGVQEASNAYKAKPGDMGFSDDSYSKALQNKYNQMNTAAMNKIKTATDFGSQDKYAKGFARINNYMIAKQNIENEAMQRQMEADRANSQARGQVLGSLLGVAGTAAGAYFGSMAGPAGGVAGAQVGGQLAGNIGRTGGSAPKRTADV